MKGESFRNKNLRQSDAEKVLLILEQNRRLKAMIIELENRISQRNEEIERLKLALKNEGVL